MKDSIAKLFVELPESWSEMLSDGNVDLTDYLANEGIDATTYFAPLPDADATKKSKDLALVILASGASAIAVGFAVSQVLSTVFRRPHRVDIYDYVEARDEDNQVVLGPDGQPKLLRVLRPEIIEPIPATTKVSGEITLNKSKGLVIKFSSISDPNSKQNN